MILRRTTIDVDSNVSPTSAGLSLQDGGFGPLVNDITIGAVVLQVDANLGGGGSSQPFRGAVAELGAGGASDVSATLALGRQVIVDSTPAGLRWVWMPFDEPPTVRAGRRLLAGYYAGGGTSVTIPEEDGVLGDSWELVPTSYVATGMPAFSGPPTKYIYRHAFAVLGVEAFVIPEVSDDALVASIPLDVLSDYFNDAGTVGDPRAASAGWHYQHDAPPPPATCVVRTGGPLEDLVGDRIRVTATGVYGQQSVALYVADEQPFDDELAAEDLSLSRVAFSRLAPLWTDLLDVTVEVLG